MADLLSSEMNMCQSVVKPDCSKPKVMKSKGIQDALLSLLNQLNCENKDLIILNSKSIPNTVASVVQMTTIEFAGVKFKARVYTGTQYINYIQNAIIKNIIQQFPKLERIVICEEKYQFTPDNFKAATHQQRKTKEKATIAHLKNPDSILNAATFKKEDIITTREGKSFISKNLATNAKDLNIEADLVLNIDSEYNLQQVPCSHGNNCNCEDYTIPIRCTFDKCRQGPKIENISTVSQRKGEAEMAQIDWLIDARSKLSMSMACCSILTSGDIDAIPIHLYSLSQNWPQINGRYEHPVYVVLQKPKKKMDIYNITEIMNIIEQNFKNEEDIMKKIAVVLCMGGNDFIPKFFNISHKKMLNLFISQQHFRINLFMKTDQGIYQLNKQVYKDFVKTLFCPRSIDPDNVSYENIRKRTIFTRSELGSLKNPKMWLPPESALDRMADLINMQIMYLETAGRPLAKLPNFLEKDCLITTKTGDIEYYFGPDAHENIEHLRGQQKRQLKETPQKGRRKKRMMTSTPSKSQNS